MNRPYITLSCAMSIDGYLDSETPQRLAMSNAADFDRVDQLRAESDAIMVGASTIRRDDPRLLVRSEGRRMRRVVGGRGASPMKVTVTASGDLPPQSSFFSTGEVEKIVYCPRRTADSIGDSLCGLATVIGLGDEVTMADVAADLADRGVKRLMVEGGGRVHTQFLVEDLVDELQLVVAPFFVGEAGAPRFVQNGRFPWTAARRARLADARRISDVVLLRYALSERFEEESGAFAHAGGAERLADFEPAEEAPLFVEEVLRDRGRRP
jgi:5-amino-6-(5-phosphoribosylamino)uracil reductase